MRMLWSRCGISVLVMVIVCATGSSRLLAIEFSGVSTGAIDQPRAFMMIRDNGVPLDAETIDPFTGLTTTTYTLEGFLDTGASTLLLAAFTVPDEGGFDIPIESGWIFEDVGVGGAEQFEVTGNTLTYHIAPYTPTTDIDNPATFNTVYNQVTGPARAIAGERSDPTPGGPVDPFDINNILDLLTQVNVFGMPVMQNKTVVMDARPTNQFIYEVINNEPITSAGTMSTFIYDTGTGFNPGTLETDPGVPIMDLHIRTSSVSFDDFVRTLGAPAGEGPAFNDSPFIGVDPFAKEGAGGGSTATRGIVVEHDGQSIEGSFLFDTGAAVSMISTANAEQLNIRYKPGFEPAAGQTQPRLQQFDSTSSSWIDVPLTEQFEVSVTGVGGTIVIAGTYFDEYKVPTVEGETNGALDLVYTDMPLLVFDISTVNPDTQEVFTLDGIFGMNALFGTGFVDEPLDLFALLASLTPGAYDWVTYDQPSGIIGLTIDPDLLLAGDTDADGDIDTNDLTTSIINFSGANGATDLRFIHGDTDGDGDVDTADINYQVINYTGALSAADLAMVNSFLESRGYAPIQLPEPATALILIGGAAVLARRRQSPS